MQLFSLLHKRACPWLHLTSFKYFSSASHTLFGLALFLLSLLVCFYQFVFVHALSQVPAIGRGDVMAELESGVDQRRLPAAH